MKKSFLLIFFLAFSFGFSQNLITTPFNDGFLGNNGGNNSATNAFRLSFLGIRNAQFSQNVPGTVFVAQGNDIVGTVLLTGTNNREHSIRGFIKWRTPSGNNPNTAVFQPEAGTQVAIATNGNNGAPTYLITGNTYIGLTFNGSALTFAENTTVTGNAATTGLLETLNTYLGVLPKITISDAQAIEGQPFVSLNLSLSASTSNQVRVNFTTQDNTAKSSVNYTATTGTVVFDPPTTTRTVSIPLIDNQEPDQNKTFFVLLSNPVNASIVDYTATVTITDTDVQQFCYKPAATATRMLNSGTAALSVSAALDTLMGITALNRAGNTSEEWPRARKGAWMVMESKTKGFVLNRLSDSQINSIPASNLVEGMLVYNTTKDVLQINTDGSAAGWKAYNTQTCPD